MSNQLPISLGLAAAAALASSILIAGGFQFSQRKTVEAIAPLEKQPTFEHEYCMMLRNADMKDVDLSDTALFAALGNVTNSAHFSPTSLIVGANKGATTGDGVTTDPAFTSLLRDVRFALWSKVFVEPIPSIYAALKANIAATGTHKVAVAVNAAVTDRDSRLPMFCWKLDADGNIDYAAFAALGLKAHSWMAGTCSLSKERLFSAYDFSVFSSLAASDRERLLLQEVEVTGLTFSSIMRSVGLPLDTVKYLQIDAEGHDAVLIHLLPWGGTILGAQNFQPALINFESVLLSTDDISSISSLLTRVGYKNRANTHQTMLWAYSACDTL